MTDHGEFEMRRAATVAEADRNRGRPPKASDIPDVRLLGILGSHHYVEHLDPAHEFQHMPGGWHNTYCLREHLIEFPEKVIWAKCSILIRRGLMDGCLCGCRGDFELTDKGEEYLAGLTIPEGAPDRLLTQRAVLL